MQENNGELESTNEIENGGEIIYPPKPVIENKPNSINRSLISMLLFIGLFYLVFEWSIVSILILAGVILIHELGHFLAMKIFNYKELGIFFVPLVGAYATGSKDNISQRQRVIILLAGPLPGVIIGVSIYLLTLQSPNTLLLRTANMFIFLNLFNLLPIMPLDGGRVLKSMFFENNVIISNIFSMISMAAMAYYAIESESYFLLIIPFFLLMQIKGQSQSKKVKKDLLSKGVNINKTYDELTDEEYWLIRDEMGRQMKYFDKIITPKHYTYSQQESRVINQLKMIIEKNPTKDLSAGRKVFVIIIWLLAFLGPALLIFIDL